MRKITVFYKQYQRYGGQEGVIWRLTHMLAESGYTVEIYTTKVKDKPQNENILVHKLKMPPLFRGLRTLLFALYAYRKAKRIEDIILGFGKTFHQDIFRSGGGVHLYYFQRARLKYKTGIARTIYTARKLITPSHWVNVWIEQKTFQDKRLKKVIVPSKFVAMQIKRHFNVDNSKIALIRNGVNLERFTPCTPDEKIKAKKKYAADSEILLGFVSTNHRLKGLEYLLEALSLLKRDGKDFKLLVAGNGSKAFFERKIVKLNLIRHVIWLGKVSHIKEVYCAIDLLIYPTLFDASSNVVLEAMACGVPVVSSVFNGTSEIIENGKEGYLINDPTNVREIYNKLKLVISNKEAITKMGLEARRKAEMYPEEAFYENFLKICKEIEAKQKQQQDS